MIQQSLPKFVKNIPIIGAFCSILMMGLITISQSGGTPPGTTELPTQPSTEEPDEVESDTTEPTRRQPPGVNQQEDSSEPPADSGKPVEVEPEPTKPTPSQPPTTETPATPKSETTQPPPKFPEPAGRVTPVENLTTLRLINQTDAVITYQVIGGQYRTLGERSVVELSKLPIPLTLTYQRSDGGLLLVRPQSVSPGVLEIRFNATEDFDLDTKSLNITGRGGVFLN